jgi:hypothetical protein
MLLPGTTVTVEGYGFSDGTKVQFGNPAGNSPEIQVSPSSVTWDRMSVQVPRFAVDGPLKVIQPGGASFLSPQTFTVHNYRNTNGFSFANFGDNTVTLDKVTELFTHDATHGWFGELTVNTRLFAGRAADELNNKGACFGMSLASLRLSKGQEPLGNYPLTAGAASPTVWNLAFTHAGPLYHYVEVQHIAQLSQVMEDYTSNWIGSSHSTGQVRSLLTQLLRASDLPIVSVVGPPGTVGHAVVAYDMEEGSGDGSFIIDVYDPNRPWSAGENTLLTHEQNEAINGRIVVSANGTWTFVGAPSPWILQGNLSHMILTPYSRIPVHPDSLPSLPENLWLWVVGATGPALAGGQPAMVSATAPAPAHAEALPGSPSLAPALDPALVGAVDLARLASPAQLALPGHPAHDAVWSGDWQPQSLEGLPLWEVPPTAG